MKLATIRTAERHDRSPCRRRRRHGHRRVCQTWEPCSPTRTGEPSPNRQTAATAVERPGHRHPDTPGKVVCVGLNYRAHILEMGRPLPEYPTLFAKFADALIGPHDDIEIPSTAADNVDWECELVVVVGDTIRGATTPKRRRQSPGTPS